MSTNLDIVRREIDEIDNELTRLFEKRMGLVMEVAEYKRDNNLPVLNSLREREIVSRVTKNQNDEMAEYTKVLFNTLFDLSRSYQSQRLCDSPLTKTRIKEALCNTAELFPKSAVVACQGIEGSNSQTACEKLFKRPNIMYFNTFEAIFQAVDKGLCKYGMLPIENSLHGSVTAVYDLMNRYNFHIARSVKLKIDHCLLVKQGTKLSDITEIYSHEQALGQCSIYLKGLEGVKIIPCENTAAAAKLIADSNRKDVAAICSKQCAELYGLAVLTDEIQNSDNNYTRFICISKDMEIYSGANKISLMFAIPHRPGSLYAIISKFSALGVNLAKLESRPISGKDFEFMFYIDVDGSVHDESIMNLICQLENGPELFTFLGSYSEA